MSGTIPLSMTQQFDVYGKPLAGGQLYIIQAGTVSTPQDAFQDTALTIKQPYPMTLDAAGRVPQFFVDNAVNATVKIRLQDKYGVVQIASDGVLIIGPAGGTGGGGGLSGDASQLFQTGDLKARYGVGIHPGVEPGWVRANGMAIGSITSTGFPDVERANSDCHDLFLFLWNQAPFDGGLVVSGGRGANATADWNANKQIKLPDWRGCVIAGLDDMGNSPKLNLTAAYFGAGTTLGAGNGIEGAFFTQNQFPNIAPAFTGTGATISVGSAANNIVTGTISLPLTVQSGGGTGAATGSGFASGSISSSGSYTPAGSVSSINGGVGQVGLSKLQPTKLCTIYIKL